MSASIVVISPCRIVAQSAAMSLSARPGFEIVGRGSTLDSAVVYAEGLTPPVVVWFGGDRELPSELQILRHAVAESGLHRIVFISSCATSRQSAEYLEAGALGFLSNDCDIDQLYEAISAVAEDRQYVGLASSRDSVRLSDMIEGPEVTSQEPALSPREREVLHFTADGLSIKEIAFLTHKSPKTIDACRRRIMHKLNTFSIAGLTKYAIREGLTSL